MSSEIKWTTEQEQAIHESGNNILVSAAAGSGKTAVLVERVIKKLTDEKEPLDIDRLLVITFTRAAAAQMREKIFKAIKEAIEKDPSSVHLRKQLMKVHTANISTIDSLCAEIVRENFQDADVDPGFKTADEAEISLLKKDILKDVLERHFVEPDESFLELVDYYTDKTETKLEDLILRLYSYAESHPAPYAWLNESVYTYQCADNLFADYVPYDETTNWMHYFRKMILNEFEEIGTMAAFGMRLANFNYGPYVYEEPFEKIAEFVQSLEGESFDNMQSKISDFLNEWQNNPRISKKDEVDEDLKELAKNTRNDIKKKLIDLETRFFNHDYEHMCKEIYRCKDVVTELIKLTIEFADELSKIKKEKKIADFSDIEHLALRILINYTDNNEIETDEFGNIVYTETAERLSALYDEIIVDEYQDTNLLQEYLINALSSERHGRPNVFMVGDVKQSIYGFRMACPSLFIEKYDRYKSSEDAGKLIILKENFRSRKNILSTTNRVFNKTMIRQVGDIEYSEGHELKYGEVYDDGKDPETEMIMISGSKEEARLSEAYAVALKIEELIKEKRFRYSDMVILSRTSNNPEIESILSERGIPVIKSAKRGFFDSFEIRLAIDLLAVVDNPYQDIELAAVLHSPICDVDPNELARIKLSGEEGESLYECLLKYGGLDWFTQKLVEWKKRSVYMDITDFVDHILGDSGLVNIVNAMPGGMNRKANLDLLKEKARSFSNGPYSGLFNFIRYIKEIKDADIDFGQAQVISKEADAVQMMTVHGSKGLEFPIVFIVNSGKGQNTSDITAEIILDRELGIGVEYRDIKMRSKKSTLLRETIKEKKKLEAYAEEMRLLYVAMTRAKEKLIITGTERYLDSKMRDWEAAALKGEKLLRYEIMGAKSWLQLLGLALYAEKGEDFSIVYKDLDDILEERAAEINVNIIEKENILDKISDEADVSAVKADMEYIYPFGKATRIQAKISPSQMEEEVSGDEPASFGDMAGSTSAALERGNAYHRFLELFDHGRPNDIEEQLLEFKKSGLMSPDTADYIDAEKIKMFVCSDIGRRMAAADREGRLFRERQFLSGTLTDINHETTLTGIEATSDEEDEEMLLVQGVIDAFFEEEGGMVLVDYKTDKVKDEAILVKRYKPQQEAYADALERIYEKPVKEKILYSLELGKEIRL